MEVRRDMFTIVIYRIYEVLKTDGKSFARTNGVILTIILCSLAKNFYLCSPFFRNF